MWSRTEPTKWTVSVLVKFDTYTLPHAVCSIAENKLSEASGGAEENGEHCEGESLDDDDDDEDIEDVPVDENLFTGEDLDELEEELNTLDLEA